MVWPEVTVSVGKSRRLVDVEVLLLEMRRSVHCGITLTLAVLLLDGGLGGVGLVKPVCTEVPSMNPVGTLMVEVLLMAAQVRPANVAVTV